MEPLGLNLGPTALEPDDYLIAPLSVRSRDDAHERRFQLNHSFSSPLLFTSSLEGQVKMTATDEHYNVRSPSSLTWIFG
jgi:hypothetical protein